MTGAQEGKQQVAFIRVIFRQDLQERVFFSTFKWLGKFIGQFPSDMIQAHLAVFEKSSADIGMSLGLFFRSVMDFCGFTWPFI